jgi:acyl-CoA synthetase (AMP-forming)/AMP-acid ligase II
MQVESVLVEHSDVAEAAVVSVPHTVKGEALYCFVTMNDGAVFGASTQADLVKMIRTKIAPFAMPDYIQVLILHPHRNMVILINKSNFPSLQIRLPKLTNIICRMPLACRKPDPARSCAVF